MKRSILILAVSLIALSSSMAAHAAHYVFTGNILTGAQFDLYPIFLNQFDRVTATAVCDPSPNNTLDTVLTAFRPGADTSSTNNAAFYNDDGGPEDCGGFHSSRLVFEAPQGGPWTFRVDGFGSATGPYTLTIDTVGDARPIPTLNEYGLILLGLLLAGFAMRGLRRRI
jgi:hypothetical protein